VSKKNKEPVLRLAFDRKILKVSVFKDEFEKMGITENMLVNEAVTHIRGVLELPKRFKLGSTKGKVRTALKDISDEAFFKNNAPDAPNNAEIKIKIIPTIICICLLPRPSLVQKCLRQ